MPGGVVAYHSCPAKVFFISRTATLLVKRRTVCCDWTGYYVVRGHFVEFRNLRATGSDRLLRRFDRPRWVVISINESPPVPLSGLASTVYRFFHTRIASIVTFKCVLDGRILVIVFRCGPPARSIVASPVARLFCRRVGAGTLVRRRCGF